MRPANEVSTERANPTLSTLLEVEEILAKESRAGAAIPLSISEIERRMAARRTRRDTVKTSVQALVHYGIAALGSKGVLYVRAPRLVTEARTEPLA